MSGIQPELPPHTLGVPPPPHVCGAVHDPQSYEPPQPSLAMPQLMPPHAVDCGICVHDGPLSTMPPSGRRSDAPHVFGSPPPPQVVPVGQAAPPPQLTRPPQPSATAPQFCPEGQVASGTQADDPPQTLGVPPPPHVAGAVQVPQSMMLPQPSPC